MYKTTFRAFWIHLDTTITLEQINDDDVDQIKALFSAPTPNFVPSAGLPPIQRKALECACKPRDPQHELLQTDMDIDGQELVDCSKASLSGYIY
jgi:hypothetical protein